MEHLNEQLKNHWKKIIGIIIICLVIDMFLHMLFPMKTDTYGMELSIIVKVIDLRIVAGIYLFISFGTIAIIFISIQDMLPGKKINKGLMYGFVIAIFWYIGIIESSFIFNSSLLDEIITATCDAAPIMILGILLGKYVATDSEIGKEKQFDMKFSIISILIIAFFLTIGRYFSYIVLNLRSSYLTNPIGTFTWTLIYALWTGISYLLLKQGLKGETSFKRSIYFGGFVFGINWLLLQLFIPLVYDFSLIELLIRLFLDIFYVFVGVFVLERFLKK